MTNPSPSCLYACVYAPPLSGTPQRSDRRDHGEFFAPNAACAARSALTVVAEQFSPRYEPHGDDLVSIDISGLERLLGTPRAIADELRREAADRGLCVHVAVATSRVAAFVLARARPGVTVVRAGEEAAALAPVSIGILEKMNQPQNTQNPQSHSDQKSSACSAVSAVKRWGIRTLGEFAALPAADVRARLGHEGLLWQAIARGDDVRPLVPARPEERFESSLELEWPIDGLEPLSFVLTRLLEPLSIRLERHDRGAAALHVHLRLVTKDIHPRRLQLPTPLRDVRTLRTLALLDLESHPPAAAIDQVILTIDPTPGRVLQHTLFTRPVPTPEQLSTLIARLTALMGLDRIGAPATVDSYRPGAFAMKPFATEHETSNRRARQDRREHIVEGSAHSAGSAVDVGALRRCRQPVPARVVVDADARPLRVTTDRRGFVGGAVTASTGPWRSSGDWWAERPGGAGEAGTAGRAGRAGGAPHWTGEGESLRSRPSDKNQVLASGGGAPRAMECWNRDEWDVTLGDAGMYRIFRDRVTDGWFIDAIFD